VLSAGKGRQGCRWPAPCPPRHGADPGRRRRRSGPAAPRRRTPGRSIGEDRHRPAAGGRCSPPRRSRCGPRRPRPGARLQLARSGRLQAGEHPVGEGATGGVGVLAEHGQLDRLLRYPDHSRAGDRLSWSLAWRAGIGWWSPKTGLRNSMPAIVSPATRRRRPASCARRTSFHCPPAALSAGVLPGPTPTPTAETTTADSRSG
jgi:hypothetical protein